MDGDGYPMSPESVKCGELMVQIQTERKTAQAKTRDLEWKIQNLELRLALEKLEKVKLKNELKNHHDNNEQKIRDLEGKLRAESKQSESTKRKCQETLKEMAKRSKTNADKEVEKALKNQAEVCDLWGKQGITLEAGDENTSVGASSPSNFQ